ncbi:MAG: hypothetical protein LBO79_04380 [Zoogloeaceae bacterium]|jgi:hypothetical protein|nr:hypothetical protein [Zoogloeaceae bacterium]
MPKKGSFGAWVGMRSDRLEIRPVSSRYVFILAGVLAGMLLGVAAGLAASGFAPLRGWRDSGKTATQDIDALRARVAELEDVVSQGDGALTNLQVSYSARQQLAEELRDLTDRYAVLEEDLSHALRLVPVGVPEGGARLDRLIVRPDALSTQIWRFSVLVGYESGRQPREFSGTLQLTLTILRDEKPVRISWPNQSRLSGIEYQQGYVVKTRHWARKTGTLELGPGDILKKVEVRLMQGHAQRAVAAVNL